jgi:hypothetical protein
MSWVLLPAADGSGEMLVCDREQSVSVISLEGVGAAWSEADAEREQLASPWRLRIWQRRREERRGPVIDRDEPTLLCVISTSEAIERAGSEHAEWMRANIEAMLRRLRRYQEGSASKAPEEGLARHAAGAELALRSDAAKNWPELLTDSGATPPPSAPEDFGAFELLVPSRPARVRVEPGEHADGARRMRLAELPQAVLAGWRDERGRALGLRALIFIAILPLTALTGYSFGFNHGQASRGPVAEKTQIRSTQPARGPRKLRSHRYKHKHPAPKATSTGNATVTRQVVYVIQTGATSTEPASATPKRNKTHDSGAATTQTTGGSPPEAESNASSSNGASTPSAATAGNDVSASGGVEPTEEAEP